LHHKIALAETNNTGWPKSRYTVIKLFFICFKVTCSALYVTC